jgi:hypothetical protein
VRILEARFHPSSKSVGGFVNVARVLCSGAGVKIEPVEFSPTAVHPFDARRLQDKLDFLVTSFPREACAGLLQLRSEFWSFVEVPGDEGPLAA